MSRPSDSTSPTSTKSSRKLLRKTARSIMRSHHFHIPKYDLPIRLRPWFLVFTCLVMVILAFLGFTNFSHALPLNDKLLHFICFTLATAVFYFIFDVEEDARRIWFWRHAGLLFTGFICFFCGGILSEFVQSMLPYKEFQFGDVVANILGSSLGLYVAYHLEKYYRHRREIARLYRPLETDSDSDDDSDSPSGTQLLPLHNQPQPSQNTLKQTRNQKKSVRFTDVWDEREELFGIGGESDDEDLVVVDPGKRKGESHGANVRGDDQRSSGQQVPQIFVTDS